MRIATGTDKFTRTLSLFDAVMLVVSGIVGASIFIVPADVLRGVGNPLLALLLWVGVGAITLIVGLVCGELGASSVSRRFAVRTPGASGANVMVIVQLELTAIAALHVCVEKLKSFGFAPSKAILEM